MSWAVSIKLKDSPISLLYLPSSVSTKNIESIIWSPTDPSLQYIYCYFGKSLELHLKYRSHLSLAVNHLNKIDALTDVMLASWSSMGIVGRLGQPAIKSYYLDEYFYRKFRKAIRELDPSFLDTLPHSRVFTEFWLYLARLDRIDSAAAIIKNRRSRKTWTGWFTNGQAHRLDGPQNSDKWYVRNKHLPSFSKYASEKRIMEYFPKHPELYREVLLVAKHNGWITDSIARAVEACFGI